MGPITLDNKKVPSGNKIFIFRLPQGQRENWQILLIISPILCFAYGLMERSKNYIVRQPPLFTVLLMPACDPGSCFTNVLRALQNILSKFVYCRNHTSYENFKLKLCMCAQSHALGTKFQLEILTVNVISGIWYFCGIILDSSWDISETSHWLVM